MRSLTLINYFTLFALVLLIPQKSRAYSILTHEAIIDASWDKSLKPLLKKKFPQSTEDDLKVARSFAYGGTLMTDVGYSPFGSLHFTNLVHYVRSGDFVESLLNEAQNVYEYAYALGALCHYMADRYGHSIGTNIVVPMIYPKVREKYGNVVTYEENHAAHSRVEIAFDVLQLARGNYASQAFHDFIGFNVSVPVLERAFFKTYGQNIHDYFPNIDKSINNFRWAVNSLMPTVTRAAWVLKKDDIKKSQPGITARKFKYRLRRKQYNMEYSGERDKPKFKERVIAFIITIIPKIGPFKAFRFKPVGPEGEKQFIKSFETVIQHYDEAVVKLSTADKIDLPNVDFDTGKLTEIGEYELTDQAYEDLVLRLDNNKFNYLSRPLKQNILSFYSKADTTVLAKKDETMWKKTGAALQHLQTARVLSADSLKLVPAGPSK
jgi:tetratricopeptide (TPR) repeat protein